MFQGTCFSFVHFKFWFKPHPAQRRNKGLYCKYFEEIIGERIKNQGTNTTNNSLRSSYIIFQGALLLVNIVL